MTPEKSGKRSLAFDEQLPVVGTSCAVIQVGMIARHFTDDVDTGEQGHDSVGESLAPARSYTPVDSRRAVRAFQTFRGNSESCRDSLWAARSIGRFGEKTDDSRIEHCRGLRRGAQCPPFISDFDSSAVHSL